MLSLHQIVERVLLAGAHIDSLPPMRKPQAPAELQPLIQAIAAEHRRFDRLAIEYGHRYRSGFWAIYLLSAVAVLCAIMPLALGWDSTTHLLHPYAGAWAVTEVGVIGTVSIIYWQGNRHDWQGQWLAARTTAELSWYLPMVAPLLDLQTPSEEPNWYIRIFDPGQHLRGADDVTRLCVDAEPLARKLLAAAGSSPQFLRSYAQWTIDILGEQLGYHHHVAAKQHVLLHRVHRATSVLFALTAVGALMHLVVHSLWLTLITTFFPALGASLHGALAQSEAYRLGSTSERLVAELRSRMELIRAAMDGNPAEGIPPNDALTINSSIQGAVALILEEHQDWHMLVRPHHLALA